ncbi:hypothetical protein M406DRAFT_74265 [Cryphonectria parasitica EP155]|uniref:Uncharacterized protein n=1 Tax=Cryphonectria parasitica (strain ATCC 38755 / EP155) TaxID=660469 RepID=A0A9P4XZL2_CRYP1|nr:uncharacterized protein M406DRAFT_74265 [Cryphonectria parasitica EP155]KAF3763690.1 hypothetical protein M406DRAFT_74265 [Cryphonectria parasitica EP155]
MIPFTLRSDHQQYSRHVHLPLQISDGFTHRTSVFCDGPLHIARRTKSESHSPHKDTCDGAQMRSIEAIHLLRGCVGVPLKHTLSKSHHSVDLYHQETYGPPGLTLYVASTSSATIHREGSSTDYFPGYFSSSHESRTPLKGYTNGYTTCVSNAMLEKSCSGPINLSSSREHRESGELDRRLRSIDEALRLGKSRGGRRGRRLYNSEVSFLVDSKAKVVMTETVPALGTLDSRKDSEHTHLSRTSSVVCYPVKSGELSSRARARYEIQCLCGRSKVEDRSGRHLESCPSQCGTSYNTPSSREGRQNARSSSVSRFSAESNTLSNMPFLCEEENSSRPGQAHTSQSAVNPLAMSDLRTIMSDLEAVVIRIEAASKMKTTPCSTIDTSIGRKLLDLTLSSVSRKQSLLSSEDTIGIPKSSLKIAREMPTSLQGTFGYPSSSFVPAVDIPPGNITGALHALRKYRRRKTSSRLSEIYTPARRPEVSGEADSPYGLKSGCTATDLALVSEYGGVPALSASLANKGAAFAQETEDAVSRILVELVPRTSEQAHFAQVHEPA